MFEISLKPRSEREASIAKRIAAKEKTNALDDFRGDRIDLPEIELEIGVPVYGMGFSEKLLRQLRPQ